jgi:cyclic pyranopterin phosphate synthase
MPTRPAPRAKSKKAASRAASVDPKPARPSHLDERGRAHMVDVGAKAVTSREAVARGRVFMHQDTLDLLRRHDAQKGDVLTVAKIAAIQGAKRCADLIPLAHTVELDGIEISFGFDDVGPSLGIEARVASNGRTGVEMEALTAVAVAALTVYDMLKAVDRGMVIGEVALWEKRGGKSGTWLRQPTPAPASS